MTAGRAGKGTAPAGRLFALREETRAAAEPILRNFTFALLMTCIGILMILGALIYCIAAA